MPFLSKKYIQAVYNGVGSVSASLLIAIITANFLSVVERGALQLIIVNVTILSVFFSLGVPFHNAYKINKDLTRPADHYLYFLSAFFCTLFSLFFYDKTVFSNVYSYILFFFSFFSFFYCSERAKNKEDLNLYSLIQIIQPTFCLIFLLMFYFLSNGFNLELVLLSYSFSYLIGFFLYLWKTKTILIGSVGGIGCFDYKFASGYWLFQISSSMVTNIDKVFLGYHLGLSQLGVYAVLQTVSSFFSRISERIAVTYFVNASDSKHEFVRRKITYYCLLFSPVMFIVGYIFGEYLIHYVFSDSYGGHGISSGVLFLSVLISSSSWIISQRATANGKPYILIIRNLLSLIVFFISINILYFTDDILNVSLANLAAALFRYVLSYYFSE